MARTTFEGPVVSKNGFISAVPSTVFAGNTTNYPATSHEGVFIRDTGDGGVLKYSDGTTWNVVAAAPVPVFAGDASALAASDHTGALIRDTSDGNKLKISNGTAWKAVTVAA